MTVTTISPHRHLANLPTVYRIITAKFSHIVRLYRKANLLLDSGCSRRWASKLKLHTMRIVCTVWPTRLTILKLWVVSSILTCTNSFLDLLSVEGYSHRNCGSVVQQRKLDCIVHCNYTTTLYSRRTQCTHADKTLGNLMLLELNQKHLSL